MLLIFLKEFTNEEVTRTRCNVGNRLGRLRQKEETKPAEAPAADAKK
ncbi:hypothetical protein [Polynucleobacter necessarius]|nr:hypothetical protein [Polynucleobacter necessarius]